MSAGKIPDAREEAERTERELGHCCGDVINIYADELEALLAGVQKRTLLAAAEQLEIQLEPSSDGDAWVAGCQDVLERLAEQIGRQG